CDTFYWEGIDGSRILTHFIPARDYNAVAKEGSAENEHFTTYNGMLNPSQVMGSWQRYSQKHINDEVLMSYGWGDGGGGPTFDMLENERRLSKGIPGAPATKQCLPTEFFHVLEDKVKDNKYLPLWSGELYLEYHRGTYTSMARNKKFNRKSEFAYQNMEFLAEVANRLFCTAYPKKELDEGWTTILRNQFHDILPGSSIKEVYDESKLEYESILAASEKFVGDYSKLIANAARGNAGDIVVINPNGQKTEAPIIIDLKDSEIKGLSDGESTYEIQKTEDGFLTVVPSVPEHGYKVFAPVKEVKANDNNAMKVSEKEVETQFFKIEIDENGKLVSIFDKKANRELVKPNEKANVLVTYEDHPHNFDAWDINNYYTEKAWEIEKADSVEVVENGPVRACIKVTYTYLSSKLVQYMYFYRDLYRFDIRNEIDWNEKNILLRNYFPMDIHATEATYEIQYGNVKRPTHYNTSWDFAKFEVCAHKWIDLSESNYGLSVINDCKFGYSIHDGVIGLTMLKSAVYPNPEADKEHHSFTYSFCPHNEPIAMSDTVAKAYVFNNPYIAVQKEEAGDKLPSEWQLLNLDAESVVTEVVKKSEDGKSLIVRMYEAQDRRETAGVKLAVPFKSACLCNVLEEKLEDVSVSDGEIKLDFKPFEIKTLRVEL
ncbi:MAG: alpha-mannosidase, partial [Lachnospiraceae bacterium]|nr:alpha-mannosidase [Lachnospiraceae bacterium]